MNAVVRRAAIGLFVTAALPLVIAWITARQRQILRRGRALTAREVAAARALGVATPERIRVLEVARIRFPGPAFLHRLFARHGFDPAQVVGLCLGHGILVRNDSAAGGAAIGHECVHTAQYERLGRARFLHRYLTECLTDGYPNAALEREARERTAEAFPIA
jgi:hypothetical protein